MWAKWVVWNIIFYWNVLASYFYANEVCTVWWGKLISFLKTDILKCTTKTRVSSFFFFPNKMWQFDLGINDLTLSSTCLCSDKSSSRSLTRRFILIAERKWTHGSRRPYRKYLKPGFLCYTCFFRIELRDREPNCALSYTSLKRTLYLTLSLK